MVGFHRGFCQNFSTVAAPLTNLLRDKVKFDWTSVCQRAFEDVKSLLTVSPVLVAPMLDKAFKLQVDSLAMWERELCYCRPQKMR